MKIHKVLRKLSLHGEKVASIILKLFINRLNWQSIYCFYSNWLNGYFNYTCVPVMKRKILNSRYQTCNNTSISICRIDDLKGSNGTTINMFVLNTYHNLNTYTEKHFLKHKCLRMDKGQ